MQTASTLYAELLRKPQHRKEVKMEVAGVEHLMRDIASLSTFGGLYTSPCVGRTASRQINVSFVPNSEIIPAMAEIRLYIRLVMGNQASEWLPKGVFYIDTRELDNVTGALTVHGYDAMLKAEQTYLAEGDTGEWPRGCDEVVAEICRRMAVSLDSRTELDSSIRVPYPNDWTMREILGYIAAAHCGNWIISDSGELRLVPLWSIPAETNYLVNEHGDVITLGGVRILV